MGKIEVQYLLRGRRTRPVGLFNDALARVGIRDAIDYMLAAHL